MLHNHNFKLYKPDQRYFLRCEECHEILEISFRLRQLLDEQETHNRSVAYTFRRATKEDEIVSRQVVGHMLERSCSLKQAIEKEIDFNYQKGKL